MAINQEPSNLLQPLSPTIEDSQYSQAHTVLVAYNATTGKPIGELPVSDEAEVRHIVSLAHAAQPAWAALSFKQREPTCTVSAM